MKLSEIINRLTDEQKQEQIALTIERCCELLAYKQLEIPESAENWITGIITSIREGNLPHGGLNHCHYGEFPVVECRLRYNFFIEAFKYFLDNGCNARYYTKIPWNTLLLRILTIERWAYDNDKIVLEEQIKKLQEAVNGTIY